MTNPALTLAARGTASALAFLLCLGCVDQEKCDEAVRVTRDALIKEQTDVARQWRDRAWEMCDDAALTGSLDQEILAKEAEIRKREEDAVKKVAEAAQQRMEAAGKVWKKFDKLDEKKKTLDNLDTYRKKADQMTKDLPDEYKKQIEKFNDTQHARRKKLIQKTAKK